MWMRCSTWVVGWLLVVGCAGANATPAATEKASVKAPVPEAGPEPVPAAATDSRATRPPADGADGADDAETKRAAAPKSDSDPNARRDITYTVAPEGLKISVAGVKFTVVASALPIAAGWGVKLNLVASAVDGTPHSLASSKAGPLAFAGFVQRQGQSEAERGGDGEVTVFGDDVTKFSRTWPSTGTRVLGIGDVLDLQIGLWGLGVEKDARRPVKQFCHVRMQVGKGKPKAIVEPPASATGK